MKGFRRRLRGTYEAGGFQVTARHWWSREDRKVARLVLKAIVVQAGRGRIPVPSRPDPLQL